VEGFLQHNADYQRLRQDQVNRNAGIDEHSIYLRLDLDGLRKLGLASVEVPLEDRLRQTVFLSQGVRYLNSPNDTFGKDMLGQHEVAIVYDLSLPLRAQIDRAARDLEGLQKHRIKTDKIDRAGTREVRQLKDAMLYLRILDAEAAGASDADIMAGLYPDLGNDYSTGRRRAHALANDRKIAHELRDGGYRRLAGKPLRRG
jgi:hypothetical protein